MKNSITNIFENDIKLHHSVTLLQNNILRTGYDPEWSLFENTFGWFQLKKEMTNDQQEKFKEAWDHNYQSIEDQKNKDPEKFKTMLILQLQKAMLRN